MSLKTSDRSEARSRALALDTELEMVALRLPRQKNGIDVAQVAAVFKEALEFKRDQIAAAQMRPPFDPDENRLINSAMGRLYALLAKAGSPQISTAQWDRALSDPDLSDEERSLFLQLAKNYRFEAPGAALPPLREPLSQRYPVAPRYVLNCLENAGIEDTPENRQIVLAVMASAYERAFAQANVDLASRSGFLTSHEPAPSQASLALDEAALQLSANTHAPHDYNTANTPPGYTITAEEWEGDAAKGLIDLTVSEATRLAIETHSSSGDWRESAQRNAKVIADIFIQENGDLLLSQVQSKHVKAVRRRLDLLPTVWGKSREDRSGGMAAVFARGEMLAARVHEAKEDAERANIASIGLSAPTVNRHMLTLKQIFDFIRDLEDGEGTRTHLSSRASFANTTVKDRRKKNNRKPVPTAYELQKLLSSPIHTGCAGVDKRFETGTIVIHDSAYWMPLLLTVYGNRSNEFCACPLIHVYDEELIPFIRIRETDERAVKTAATNRDLPIAPKLIELGFLDYIKNLRLAGEKWLFPELNRTKERASKVFMDDVFRPLMEHVFPEGTSARVGKKDIDTQSFRKFLASYLRKGEPKIDKGIRQAFFGHERDTTLEATYEDDPSVEELLPCVEKSQKLIEPLIRFPIRMIN